MIDPTELASALLHGLEAEHVACAAQDAVWIDELERRRRDLAAAGVDYMLQMKLAAGLG